MPIPENETRLSGPVAQSGERLLCKQEVVGSIPTGSTNPQRAMSAGEASSTATHDRPAARAGRGEMDSRGGAAPPADQHQGARDAQLPRPIHFMAAGIPLAEYLEIERRWPVLDEVERQAVVRRVILGEQL